MSDEARDPARDPGRPPFSLPDIAELEAHFAAEEREVPTHSADAAPSSTATGPAPAPNWGIDTYAARPAMPPLRRILVPVFLVVAAVVVAAYLLADAPRPDPADASYQALVDYVDHVAAAGADAPVADELVAALATAKRGTAPDGAVRLSLRGAEGCWSVLLPATLVDAAPGTFPDELPRPLLVDRDTCR